MTAYSLGRLSLFAALLHASVGHAQVSPSATQTQIISSANGNTPTSVSYDITGGWRPNGGPNLFHSFGDFSLAIGDVANFRNDTGAATSNILGRVTGGNVSNIFGTISTSGFANAHLFLINPAGWVFGPTASLQVEGSFHASTAHYLLLDNGQQFAADASQALSSLQSAAPVAFGFLGPTGSISINGDPGIPTALSVPSGQTLSFVGGDVQINGQTLAAPSGRVQIGSFASAGQASVDGLNGTFSALGSIQISGSMVTAADFDGFNGGGTVLLRGGQIDVNNLSLIDVSGNPAGTAGGTIIIRGGQLIVDNSTIGSQTFSDVNSGAVDLSLDQKIEVNNAAQVVTLAFGSGRGGDIHLAAPQMTISGDGASVSTTTFGDGRAGDVSVQAQTLAIMTGGSLGSVTQAAGRGGDVNVSATESVKILGRDSASNPSSIFTQSFPGAGDAGQLMVSTPLLTMSDGASIISASFGGRAGDINVAVDTLSIDGGAMIKSFSQGSGGNINVVASGSVTVSGTATDGAKSGILTDTTPTSAAAGDISIQAKTITVTGGALVESGTESEPGGGSVTLTASNAIAISDGGGVAARGQQQDVKPITISTPNLVLDNGFISATTLGPGHGGDIGLQVGSLTLTQGGQIASSTEGAATGTAGNVTVNANSVSISGSLQTALPSTPFNTDPRSGIFSAAHSSGNGNAGQISVTSASLSLTDGGTISAATTTGGAAGNVTLNVGSLSMTSAGTINSSTTSAGAGGAIVLNASSASISGAGTGLFSTASNIGNAGQITVSGGSATVADGSRVSTSTTGAGNAGTITANVGSLNVSGGQLDSSTTASGAGGSINVNASSQASVVNGGRVSADSTGSGATGNITIAAGNRITMDGGSISTRALTSDGGNITLKAPLIVRLENSQITTSVQSGVGSGGNVLIDPQFLVMNNSAITANAFGGPGGNITIIADNFLASSTALLQASSALSTPGTIQIQSPENNVAGSIAQLPRAFVDASRLMRGACSARREGAPSSFVLAGRGGVPAEADGYLPSTIISAPPTALTLAHLDDCAR